MKLHPPSPATAKPADKRSAPTDVGPIMTLGEATDALQCHRVTILRLIRRGQIHPLRTGNSWSFLSAEINALRNRNIAVYPHLTIARKSTNPAP